MSIESLQRAAEAAGFATASDDNQDAPIGSARAHEAAPASNPASLLAKPRVGVAAANAATQTPLPTWSLAGLGSFIPNWAIKA